MYIKKKLCYITKDQINVNNHSSNVTGIMFVHYFLVNVLRSFSVDNSNPYDMVQSKDLAIVCCYFYLCNRAKK